MGHQDAAKYKSTISDVSKGSCSNDGKQPKKTFFAVRHRGRWWAFTIELFSSAAKRYVSGFHFILNLTTACIAKSFSGFKVKNGHDTRSATARRCTS
jgi:hypothetical protein